MSLFKRQDQVSPMRPMPVDDKGNASQVTSVSGESIQLYYYNGSDVRTIDAGQVTGTLVEGKLIYDNIKNQSGAFEGTWQDTSLAFTSGVFVSSQRKYFDFTAAEATDDTGATARLASICAGFVNGDWTLDHTSGLIYGKKATTGVTLAAGTYKVLLPVSGAGGPTANVNVNQVAGSATAAAQGAITSGTLRVTEGSSTLQAQGTDAVGADAYATVKTAGALATHLLVSLGGTNDAVVSLNGGVTDSFTIQAGTTLAFDAVTIAAATAIQAKNATPGSNYADIAVSIW